MSQRFSPRGFSSNKESSVLLIAGPPGDDSRFAEMLHESRRDATLRRVHGLERGRAALREEAPDVVIVDLDLPDQDGTTAIAHCAAAAPPVPIVALTSSDAMPSAQSIEEAGAAECLRKDHLTPALIGKTLRWVQERRQMQDTIRKQDAWFRSMTDNVSEGVFRAGPTGRIEYANEAFAALFGYERGEEMQGIDFTTLYANPEQRGRMMAGEGAERAELSFRRPDGTTFTGLLNATAARDPNGKVQHFDGVLVDIDERKERERKLRVLSGAVEQANEAVLITDSASPDDPGRRIVFANDAFEEMTGYSEAEVLGETPRILQGPETDRETLDSLREALENGEEWEGEVVNYRKDGTPYYVQWNVAPVRDENGDVEQWVSIQRDVTDRRRREEKLREQNSLLEQTQRLAGAWEVDLRAGKSSGSEEMYRILEVENGSELTVDESFQFFTPEAHPKLREAFEQCVEEGEPYDLELPVVTAEGKRRWVRVVGAPSEVEGGTITKVAGALQDITDRREATEELQKARNYYEQVLNQLPIDLAIFDPEGRYEYVNAHGVGDSDLREWILGHTNEEYCRKRGFDPKVGQRRDRAIREAARSGERVELDETLKTDEGLRHFFRVHSPVTNLEGQVTNVAAFGFDITERKEAEQQLREREARLRGLADSIPGVIYQFVVRSNEPHQFRFVGERAEDLLGISSRPDGFFERLVHQVPAGYQEKLLVRIEEAVEHEESWSLEIPFEKPSGEQRWLHSAATPERVGDDLTFSGVLLDITKRRQLERKVIAISDEEQRRIGEDLHDILASRLAGTAMVARSSATSLESGNDPSADRLHEVADRIEEASEQARSLSHSLMPLEIQDGGLPEGLRNLADRQESLSEVTCSFEAEGRVELSEEVAAHLYRVVAEAVHNALRHADPDRVEICLQFEENHLVLSVEDDGKGIPEEVDSSDTHGLQLMQYRSDLIGAHLDIEPLEEGGTLVRCSLPLDEASEVSVE